MAAFLPVPKDARTRPPSKPVRIPRFDAKRLELSVHNGNVSGNVAYQSNSSPHHLDQWSPEEYRIGNASLTFRGDGGMHGALNVSCRTNRRNAWTATLLQVVNGAASSSSR